MGKKAIAVIGLGKISMDQHIPVIDASSDFELQAVVSQRGLSHGDVPSFKTPAELYQALPEIRAVAINTPPDVRHKLAREALNAGMDVLLEKPPAATLTELVDLEDHAEKLGRVLFATWHSQCNLAVDEAKGLLAKHGVRSLKMEWREDVRKWHPGQDWVWAPGGFGVFDPGINALSIFSRILPFQAFIKSADLTFPANRQTPIAAKLRFASNDSSEPTLLADFDWREEGRETWQMLIETADGEHVRLFNGGAALSVDGDLLVDEPNEEYQRIYTRFNNLLDQGRRDVDGAPLRLVADAMLIGERRITNPFDW